MPVKVVQIDVSCTYPCPCRRQGRLSQITLTDALGCQRCQQIFEVKPDGYTIEQLSTSYPSKRSWYWTGEHWHPIHKRFNERCVFFLLGLTCFLVIPVILWLPVALRISLSLEVLLWFILTIVLVFIPAMIVWVTLYRR